MMLKIDLPALRNDPNINRLVSSRSARFVEGDYCYMVACVEESNADFEGFLFRAPVPGVSRNVNEGSDTLLGYPVDYSDDVQEDEAFGGMWSDLDEHGRPRHSAAFVRMVRE